MTSKMFLEARMAFCGPGGSGKGAWKRVPGLPRPRCRLYFTTSRSLPYEQAWQTFLMYSHHDSPSHASFKELIRSGQRGGPSHSPSTERAAGHAERLTME